MASFEFLAIILTGLGIIVSVLYYTTVLQNANKTRQTQLFMQLFDRIASEENRMRSMQILELDFLGYDDFENKYNMSNNPEIVGKVLHIWMEFTGMGYLLRKGFLDVETLNQIAGHIVVPHWNKWKQYIFERREREKEPAFVEEFEYLAKEIINYRETKDSNR